MASESITPKSPSTGLPRHVRLGVLVPSSNTALEPLTTSIISSIAQVPESQISVSVHFSRFRVTQISLDAGAKAQFDLATILYAASLLADAQVNVIGWSGTSAGWLGFDSDEKLCEAIENEFGIPATTSTLALNKLLNMISEKSLGLVTPYTDDLNDAIRQTYASIGVEITPARMRGLGITRNTDIVNVDEHTLKQMVAEVAESGATVVTTFCTNLRAAQMADLLEKTHDIVVLDTVSTVVWGMLRKLNISTEYVKGWGKMFTFGPSGRLN